MNRVAGQPKTRFFCLFRVTKTASILCNFMPFFAAQSWGMTSKKLDEAQRSQMQKTNDTENSKCITSHLAVEIYALLICTLPYSKRVPHQMLREIKLADYSAKIRWKFTTSAYFTILIISHFIISTYLNSTLDTPNNTLNIIFQFLAATFIYATAFILKKSIPIVLAESIKTYSLLITHIPHTAERFISNVEIIESPPPDFKISRP